VRSTFEEGEVLSAEEGGVMVDFGRLLRSAVADGPTPPRAPRVEVEAMRTDCFTGAVKYVTVKFYVEYHESNLNAHYLHIEGGPTGYESMAVSSISDVLRKGGGWLACMGTERRWDALHIMLEPYAKAVAMLGFIETTCEGCDKRIIVMPSDDVPVTLCPPCGGGSVFGGFVEAAS
jgi:hypothetical protein